MPQIAPTNVPEQSTCKVTISFADPETDAAIIPTTATWSLMTLDGTIINSRDAVSIAVPAASNDIFLTGDDLKILDSTKAYENRILAVEGTYTSDAVVRPIRQEVWFRVENLRVTT